MPTSQGTVKFYNVEKRFGFLLAGGKEYFVHRTGLQDVSPEAMKQGAAVTFEIGANDRGVCAVKVQLATQAAAAAVPNTVNLQMAQWERAQAPQRIANGEIPARAAVAAVLRGGAARASCHLALRYYKGIDTWKRGGGGWGLDSESKTEFFERVIDLNVALAGGEGKALLANAHARLDRLGADLSARGWAVETCAMATMWRLVSGLGIAHPFETGFAFHHTLGVPFLPGSSVKGAAGAFAREDKIFGKQDAAGEVVFFDAMPVQWPMIELDIVNPHYGEYYRGSSPPGDYLNPIPVHFLAIAPGQAFKFMVAARAPRAGGGAAVEMAKAAMAAVKGAAGTAGLGGKSAVGYGYFA